MSLWRDQLLHLLSCILCAPATVFPPNLLISLSYISSSLFLPPVFLYSFSASSYIPHLCPSLCIFPAPLSCPFPILIRTSLILLSFLSILAPQERNAVIFLLLPKPPLENIGLIKVKGKGLKRKVFHASCEWYAGPENSKVPSLCFFLPIPLFYNVVCVAIS